MTRCTKLLIIHVNVSAVFFFSHVATSVADLHTIDDTPMPSIFHNDSECIYHFILVNMADSAS